MIIAECRTCCSSASKRGWNEAEDWADHHEREHPNHKVKVFEEDEK